MSASAITADKLRQWRCWRDNRLRIVQCGDDVAEHCGDELLTAFVLYFFSIIVGEIKAVVGAAFFGIDSGEFNGETKGVESVGNGVDCLLYTSPSPRDQRGSRMPSSA